jgi:osmotically-inducible protein OsmY
MDDGLIKRDVEDELEWEPSVNAAEIGVAVSSGLVTLTGRVTSLPEKWAAERAAARVGGVADATRNLFGVRGVSNLVTERPADWGSDVKAGIEAALRRSAEIDASRITVAANGNKVTLLGSVSSCSERQEAERATWAAPGVLQVENFIIVIP